MDYTDFTTHLPSSRPEWITRFAQVGLTAKGVVYCIVGALAFMAAFEINGTSEQSAGKQGVFRFILEQPYGQVLLALIAIGMLCYAIWRFIQAVKDTENRGSDAKGIAARVGYAFSGVVYGGLAFYAATLALGSSGGSGGGGSGDSRQSFARELLSQPYGIWLLSAVALGIIGTGIYQIYRAYSGRYMKNVNSAQIKPEIKKTLIRAGKVGYAARGIVWMVIGFLFMRAAMSANPSEAGGSGQAFQFIEQNTFGSFILGAVAIGLICYGVFMFVRARYENIQTT
ncbi:DUF1206 domain-containing protein [Botryobacter ruber]|uniref:DUF1206 domain-containing protein n=1 Tax=Botryobacter ruber TaxID=2171629 RepID=UPI000E0AF40E|nr:DUF1206 domain-containing protein [Botryobacter ruber]